MATENHVVASSFADPADIRRFRRCKAIPITDKDGKFDRWPTDEECFRVGDNGVGYWGDDCSEGSGPSCALPPEVMIQNWGSVSEAKHKLVLVTRLDVKNSDVRQVVCIIKDTMPHLAHIHNGARIDLNPDAVRALWLEPPIMANVVWMKAT